ncbi:Protein BONZAI 3 [Vitis vinifera]|uniref:Protein BONZAI 3 n=1 Tax=Vitis vinifera TaxID=29760 RepID=A0A438KBX3_VITVI|nr:Protein BONZAI 3 [Vitis vinifera]
MSFRQHFVWQYNQISSSGGLKKQVKDSKPTAIHKSDPMVVVYTKKRDGTLEELGRTEVIMNSLDPAWIKKITVAYHFEIVQPLIFHVYDVDTKYYNLPVKMLKLNDQEFLGEGGCVLSEIVTKQGQSLTLDLHNRNGNRGLKNLGKLTVHAEETVSSRNAIEDPFLRISRIVENGGSVPICKTEVVDNNLNPIWRPLCLTMQQFVSKASFSPSYNSRTIDCLDNPLVIECFDFNSSGNHVLIGKLQKSVADLEKLHKQKTGASFILPSSAQHGHEKVLKGQLFVDQFCEKQLHSFIDYVSSGFELNFMVAVDFTAVLFCPASNGNPRTPDSLHYIDPSGQFNAYQQAIMEVGEVIQFYDTDRRFPAWGFGGRTIDGTISHCFNLNGSASGVEVEGVQGIMAAYASALNHVALAGPTLFGQVINNAAEIAGQSLSYNSCKYFVLLIITDGVLTDLQETKDALVRASDLPLSILIVGVGGADFKQMEILDADNGCPLESSTGRVATRDIVQFVPMREVRGEYIFFISLSSIGGQTSVVQALLQELPGQFLTYMRSRDIKPSAVNIAQTSASHATI